MLGLLYLICISVSIVSFILLRKNIFVKMNTSKKTIFSVLTIIGLIIATIVMPLIIRAVIGLVSIGVISGISILLFILCFVAAIALFFVLKIFVLSIYPTTARLLLSIITIILFVSCSIVFFSITSMSMNIKKIINTTGNIVMEQIYNTFPDNRIVHDGFDLSWIIQIYEISEQVNTITSNDDLMAVNNIMELLYEKSPENSFIYKGLNQQTVQTYLKMSRQIANMIGSDDAMLDGIMEFTNLDTGVSATIINRYVRPVYPNLKNDIIIQVSKKNPEIYNTFSNFLNDFNAQIIKGNSAINKVNTFVQTGYENIDNVITEHFYGEYIIKIDNVVDALKRPILSFVTKKTFGYQSIILIVCGCYSVLLVIIKIIYYSKKRKNKLNNEINATVI